MNHLMWWQIDAAKNETQGVAQCLRPLKSVLQSIYAMQSLLSKITTITKAPLFGTEFIHRIKRIISDFAILFKIHQS
jgi:hypothetical protein